MFVNTKRTRPTVKETPRGCLGMKKPRGLTRGVSKQTLFPAHPARLEAPVDEDHALRQVAIGEPFVLGDDVDQTNLDALRGALSLVDDAQLQARQVLAVIDRAPLAPYVSHIVDKRHWLHK